MPNKSSDRVDATGEAIDEVLSSHPYELVAAYYCPDPKTYGARSGVLCAGRYFDELGDNPRDAFTPADLAAASLLDVRFGPSTVRSLIDNDKASALLSAVDPALSLWKISSESLERRDSAVWELWSYVVAIPGIGRTRASKLLARKRPSLMPILDSVVLRGLELHRTNQWTTLKAVLTAERRGRINELAEAATSQGARQPSTLRLLDVATWMKHSESRNMRAVRASLEQKG